MSERMQLIVYLVGVVVMAACIFWNELGRAETEGLVAGTIFGGFLWPIFLVLLVLGGIGEGIHSLNMRRRATLATRDAAKAETARWLKEGMPACDCANQTSHFDHATLVATCLSCGRVRAITPPATLSDAAHGR